MTVDKKAIREMSGIRAFANPASFALHFTGVTLDPDVVEFLSVLTYKVRIVSNLIDETTEMDVWIYLDEDDRVTDALMELLAAKEIGVRFTVYNSDSTVRTEEELDIVQATKIETVFDKNEDTEPFYVKITFTSDAHDRD